MYFECILSQLLSKKMTACLDFFYPSTSLIKITTPFPQVQNFHPSIPNSFHCFSGSDPFWEKSSPIFPFISINLYSYFFNDYSLFLGFRLNKTCRHQYSTLVGTNQSTRTENFSASFAVIVPPSPGAYISCPDVFASALLFGIAGQAVNSTKISARSE